MRKLLYVCAFCLFLALLAVCCVVSVCCFVLGGSSPTAPARNLHMQLGGVTEEFQMNFKQQVQAIVRAETKNLRERFMGEVQTMFSEQFMEEVQAMIRNEAHTLNEHLSKGLLHELNATSTALTQNLNDMGGRLAQELNATSTAVARLRRHDEDTFRTLERQANFITDMKQSNDANFDKCGRALTAEFTKLKNRMQDLEGDEGN